MGNGQHSSVNLNGTKNCPFLRNKMGAQKVAIYCRLSEEDRNKRCETDDSNSIKNQKSMLVQHALEQGWIVHDIYSDDDYAGSDRGRPEFNRLLADAEKRKFDIVLCKTQSRFTRELELVEKYIHGLFPLWGIRFVSIVDNADTDNKGNKKSRQINGLVNEWYLEDMSENIRSVLTDRRKNGYHIGSFAVYGYRKDPNQRGHLLVDEEAAAIVREVFALFAQGHGKVAIARMLNDRGIPNPTEYKRLRGLSHAPSGARTGTLWTYHAIADMLVNEIYIGNMVQGKYGSVSYKTKKNKPRPKEQWYRVVGTHEPIIDMALWNRVQAMAAQKARAFKTGKIGLFACKAHCMDCGHVMRSSKSHNKHYLRCATRHVAKDACAGCFIPVAKLEEAVIAELNKLSAAYLDKDALEGNVVFGSDLKGRKKTLEANVSAYQRKMKEYETGIRSLYLDKVKGALPESQYLDMSKDFQAEKERLGHLIKNTKAQIAAIEKNRLDDGDRRQVIEQYANLEHLDRRAVETFIDYILVGRKDPETKERLIEIHWNF